MKNTQKLANYSVVLYGHIIFRCSMNYSGIKFILPQIKPFFFKLINHNHKSDYQNIKLAFLTSYSNENYGNMEN